MSQPQDGVYALKYSLRSSCDELHSYNFLLPFYSLRGGVSERKCRGVDGDGSGVIHLSHAPPRYLFLSIPYSSEPHHSPQSLGSFSCI